MSSFARRLFTSLLALAAAVLAATMPTAFGDPGQGGDVSVDPTLSLAALGSSSYLAFYGQQAVQSLTLPVQQGLGPAELTATVWPPADVRSATITVTQDNRVISRVSLPVNGPAPIGIPLPGAQIVDNAMTLTLSVYLLPLEGYCLDPTNPLRLTDMAVRFAGIEQPPSTVADFLPPVLRKLTIFLPASPSRAESDAAVQLTDAVVAHYGQQYTDVSVAALPDGQTVPPGLAKALERQIVIKEGPNKGVSLQVSSGVPSLLISGAPNELTNQTRLLSSNISRLAMGSAAVAGPLKSTPQLPGDRTTLEQMGQKRLNTTSLSPQVMIGIDQTRLGRSAHNIRVHLRGSYTPLPSTINGQLVALVGGQSIDRWTTDREGVIDRWVSIPDNLLQRYTTLTLAIDITGNTGRCGEFQPITLTIDGQSTVESSPARPPVPYGFQSLPQALMPRVPIGIGQNALADTARAVAIVTGLQRVSALPMDTTVVSVQEAIHSANPAIIISADGWDHPDIPLPVKGGGDQDQIISGFDDAGNHTTLTLTPSLRFGSLQTVFDGNRSLLIATSTGAADQLDGLISWLNADIHRWSTLNGVALLAPPGRAPVSVAGPTANATSSSGGSGSGRTWLLAGAGVAVAVALGASLYLLGARRRT